MHIFVIVSFPLLFFSRKHTAHNILVCIVLVTDVGRHEMYV